MKEFNVFCLPFRNHLFGACSPVRQLPPAKHPKEAAWIWDQGRADHDPNSSDPQDLVYSFRSEATCVSQYFHPNTWRYIPLSLLKYLKKKKKKQLWLAGSRDYCRVKRFCGSIPSGVLSSICLLISSQLPKPNCSIASSNRTCSLAVQFPLPLNMLMVPESLRNRIFINSRVCRCAVKIKYFSSRSIGRF